MNWSPECANFLKSALERELTLVALPATPHKHTIFKDEC